MDGESPAADWNIDRIGHYELGAVLGRGSFAVVRLAEDKVAGKKYAMKLVDPSKSILDEIHKEIRLQQKVKHPHVIELHEAMEVEPGKFALRSEYADNGDLLVYVVGKKRLSECEARRLFMQIASGVQCCHENGIVHRDMKCENILLDADFNAKVTDFGLSAELLEDGAFLTEKCASAHYAAPELLTSMNCAYRTEVDVWSCGVILYVMLSGSLPFDDDDLPRLFENIRQARYDSPSYFSRGAKDVVGKLLTISQAARVTLKAAQMHPWLTVDLKDIFDENGEVNPSYFSWSRQTTASSCTQWGRQTSSSNCSRQTSIWSRQVSNPCGQQTSDWGRLTSGHSSSSSSVAILSDQRCDRRSESASVRRAIPRWRLAASHFRPHAFLLVLVLWTLHTVQMSKFPSSKSGNFPVHVRERGLGTSRNIEMSSPEGFVTLPVEEDVH